MIKNKKCSKCKNNFPATYIFFGKDKSRPDGFDACCRKCKPTKSKEWNDSKKGRNYKLKYNFGITLEQYDQMFEQQNGVCVICGKTNSNGRRLYVDHSHKTGKIRGLLCHKCNTGLSGFGENEEYLLQAALYLEKYKKP